jgi:pimeloyl-ACP methyl ester carboxylesterase
MSLAIRAVRNALLLALSLVAAYVLFILALLLPAVQRPAFYAHHANPTLWQNLSDVEAFGFLPRQVQPFTLTTRDNETLFAWHILPVHLYLEHEAELLASPEFGVKTAEAVVESVALRVLAQDPEAVVVVNFHGNAAHLASAQRPATYGRQLGLSRPDRPVHVFTFDYRGYGLSSGSPTEEGLIADGETMLSFVTGLKTGSRNAKESERKMGSVGVDPSRIIVFGQSLGTAVSTGLTHRWYLTNNLPSFKALILVSGFTAVPELLDTYSLKGIVPPFLTPLKCFPRLQEAVVSKIADPWRTRGRIADLMTSTRVLDLTILHAADDWEIPWRQGFGNAIVAMNSIEDPSCRALALQYDKVTTEHHSPIPSGISPLTCGNGDKRLRWELAAHGGHNNVAMSHQAGLAIERVLSRKI